jgi:hypothetical protein
MNDQEKATLDINEIIEFCAPQQNTCSFHLDHGPTAHIFDFIDDVPRKLNERRKYESGGIQLKTFWLGGLLYLLAVLHKLPHTSRRKGLLMLKAL